MKNRFRLVMAGLAWITLALQYGLMVGDSAFGGFLNATVYYFGYFTILTNILVALGFSVSFLGAKSGWRQFFEKPAVRAALALYILVVAVVYHLMLADDHTPTGWNIATNVMLHTLLPVAYLFDWFVFAKKRPLSFTHIPFWILFPLGYGLLTLLKGMVTKIYPYPFMDVTALGFPRVLITMVGFTMFYAVGACVFIALGRALPDGKSA